MQVRAFNIDDLRNISIGETVTADDIARLSAQNRVKGIHPIELNGTKVTVILCTLSGGDYPNEWLDGHNTLKYYLEGKTDESGRKVFNDRYKSNQSVIRSTVEGYPVMVFCRVKKGIPFSYEGQFYCERVEKKSAYDQYFVLRRKTSSEMERLIQRGLADDRGNMTDEGKQVIRLHQTRERDPKIIKAAIARAKAQRGKITCEICDFDFGQVYGERGQDYIEGHHKIPLSELDAGGGTTHLDDIALLCANCHRIIHRRKPWLSIEAMKQIIAQQTGHR